MELDKLLAGYSWHLIVIGCLPSQEVCEGFRAVLYAGYIMCSVAGKARRAVKLRYVDGLSWQAVAGRMGYACADTPRKMCERYIAKQVPESAG